MAKSQPRWHVSPPKRPKPKVPESVKMELERKAGELLESVLKPTHLAAPPQDVSFNYVVDLYFSWHGNCLYFCAKYACPGPNAISPFFEMKFARLEYVGDNHFALAYMRHTGKWWEVHPRLSLDECLAAVGEDPLFSP